MIIIIIMIISLSLSIYIYIYVYTIYFILYIYIYIELLRRPPHWVSRAEAVAVASVAWDALVIVL